MSDTICFQIICYNHTAKCKGERIEFGGNKNSGQSRTKDLAEANEGLNEDGGSGNGKEAENIMEVKQTGPDN